MDYPLREIFPKFCFTDPHQSRQQHSDTTAMAKPKASKSTGTAVAKTAKASEGALMKKGANDTPYHLDPAQVERAATALVKNMKEHAKTTEENADKKNLAADEDEPEQDDAPIFLNLITKQHIKNQHRLKPSKM
jgi:ribosome biogenesis protein UTP30